MLTGAHWSTNSKVSGITRTGFEPQDQPVLTGAHWNINSKVSGMTWTGFEPVLTGARWSTNSKVSGITQTGFEPQPPALQTLNLDRWTNEAARWSVRLCSLERRWALPPG